MTRGNIPPWDGNSRGDPGRVISRAWTTNSPATGGALGNATSGTLGSGTFAVPAGARTVWLKHFMDLYFTGNQDTTATLQAAWDGATWFDVDVGYDHTQGTANNLIYNLANGIDVPVTATTLSWRVYVIIGGGGFNGIIHGANASVTWMT